MIATVLLALVFGMAIIGGLTAYIAYILNND